MFRYLGEKIPMSDTDTDIYHCEVLVYLCIVYVCFFPIDVTAIQDTVFICMHI